MAGWGKREAEKGILRVLPGPLLNNQHKKLFMLEHVFSHFCLTTLSDIP